MIGILIKYLGKNNYSHLREDFKESYQSHPNYPSLYAATDSFSFLSIENIAAKIPLSQIESMPEYFMAQVNKDTGSEFVLVEKKLDKIILEYEKGKKKRLEKKEFLEIWTGLIVAIEPSEIIKKIKPSFNSKYYLLILFGLVLLSIGYAYEPLSLLSIIYKVTTFIGLIIGILILQEKFSEDVTAFVSKVCGGETDSSCDNIIDSESKLLKLFNYTDLPFIFFGVNFLLLSLSSTYTSTVALFSIFSIPIVFHSFYLQWFELKSRCILCLMISGLILLQSISYLVIVESYTFNYNQIILYVLLTAIFFIVWNIISNFLLLNKGLNIENKSLKRFKRDFKLFQFLSKDVQLENELNNLYAITLGEGKISLRLFLSPSCGHCHQAYKDALTLLERYPKQFSLKIYYNLNPQNKKNRYSQVAKLITHYSLNDLNKTEECLEDWHIKNISIEDWLKRWDTKISEDKVEEIIQKQFEWCKENDFNFTPIKLINNKKYPEEYEILDIRYFINDLKELQIEKQTNNTLLKVKSV